MALFGHCPTQAPHSTHAASSITAISLCNSTAPNEQYSMHTPQPVHLSISTFAAMFFALFPYRHNRVIAIAPRGHSVTHLPHSRHFPLSIFTIVSTEIAPVGQISAHCPQTVHSPESITITRWFRTDVFSESAFLSSVFRERVFDIPVKSINGSIHRIFSTSLIAGVAAPLHDHPLPPRGKPCPHLRRDPDPFCITHLGFHVSSG
jgi:hypothetical protein